MFIEKRSCVPVQYNFVGGSGLVVTLGKLFSGPYLEKDIRFGLNLEN